MAKLTQAVIERLIKFLMSLVLFLHIFACAWVNLGWEDNGWVKVKHDNLPNDSESTVYLAGLYWAITTFSTIGYGDFVGANTNDYLFTMAVFVLFSHENITIAIRSVHVFVPAGKRQRPGDAAELSGTS